MLRPLVLVLFLLWLLGIVLDISGAGMLLVIAAILTISNLLLSQMGAVSRDQ
jgi:hypothetical protein